MVVGLPEKRCFVAPNNRKEFLLYVAKKQHSLTAGT